MEFQKEELDEILNIFQQESMEIISSMDGKLLMLEKDSSNAELAMHLFRDAHSLKGSARMLGFEDIQNIAHKIEDIISLVRENKLVLTSEITDIISECLEFISFLINKTVAQKEEYKSPDVPLYIQKLENISKKNEQKDSIVLKNEDLNPYKQEFINKFAKIEDIIIDVLYIVSKARQKNDYESIYVIESSVSEFLNLISNIDEPSINSFKNAARNIVNALDKFRTSDNKALEFLDLNSNIIALIELITNYANKEHIEKKDYYEIVENKLNEKELPKEEIKKELEQEAKKEIQQVKEISFLQMRNDKIEEIIQKIPLLELNLSFLPDIVDLIDSLIIQNPKTDYENIGIEIKDILNVFKDNNVSVTRDVALAIKENLSALKDDNQENIKEVLTKLNMVRKMVKFNTKDHRNKSQNSELTQKDILNTITNSEIKTLRVDSLKLDNLVGQIGELIVSKIKTNEQLSLVRKINNDLIEWQKNFARMGYYIKYFDKKYLSNQIIEEGHDYRKVIAYNKQLCSLCEMHNDKIASLIKETSNLFKQIQESETKLNSTTSEIETMVKNMRILPLSTIFQLFPRMVHNIARDKNKKIDLVINGSDITADKTIIEEMKIPLMHIIRNSIDHGIEDVETRKALGKNPIGKIEITAIHKDNKVVIDVKDDGRGLDIEKIKQKALEKRLLTEEELGAISDDELTNLIFYPGFSTENFVTELSGRGLGLDIVNNKINHLQGRIDIFSQLNQGTIVRIILPATVATKKVFIIEEQRQLWAIENSVIKTIVRVNADEVFEKDNHNYYIYDGAAISIYTLSQILNYENVPRETNKYTLMIIETDNTIFGIIVEKLISDQEIVHKKLAPPLYKVKHISGITTLANGEACLILNVGDIINTINSKKIKTKIITKNGIVKTQDNFKYKILIVDDSHTTRILQKNILSNNGYNVSTATNPINALDKVKQAKYDLVISDIQMPEMNGFEFIGELRKMQNYEETPVIVVSSEPKDDYQIEIEETKVAKYIQKNLFKQEELLASIEKLLNINI